MAFLGNAFGIIFKYMYKFISSIGTEPKYISYYAITVILMTLLFKLMTLPLNLSQTKGTQKMSEIQPELKKIQEKYKADPETQNRKLMELYKEHNYNPASGCLPLLIQFPILIGFWNMMREPVKYIFKDPKVYDAITKNFFWIANLEKADIYLWGLPLLAAATTFLQSYISMRNMPSDPATQSTQKMMNIFMPVMIFGMSRSLPAGLALYWVLGNIFVIIQTLISNAKWKRSKEERV